jgi:hypothetical protein
MAKWDADKDLGIFKREEPEVSKELTPFEQAELRFLRNNVDRLQDEKYRRDARPDINKDLWEARENLDLFVRGLRKEGRSI